MTRKPSSARLFFIAIIAAAGGFILTYDLILMSSAILFLQPYFHLTSGQKSFAMTSASIGVFAGLLIASTLADSLGRKWSLFLASVLFLGSALGTTFPGTYLMWNIYRIIGGVACGLAMMISPMYIAEIAPPRKRGLLVTCNQLAMMLGALLSAIVCYYISKKISGTEQWRWMFASVCPPMVFFAVGLLFIPRSPRWLIQKGRIEDARRVLTMIDGPEHAERELREIEGAVHVEQGGYAELFSPNLRMALIIAVALAVYQQICGVSTLTFYAPSIFEAAGIGSKSDAILQTIILRIWDTGTTLFAFFMVDRLGRRPLLLWGALGMALGQIIMGFSVQWNLSAKALLAAMFLGEGSYTLSLAPLAWLIMSEIFPTRVRAKGMMLASLLMQIAAYLVNLTFQLELDFFKDKVGIPGMPYWIFAVICISSVVFSYFFVPETKNKTLEEISASLSIKGRKTV